MADPIPDLAASPASADPIDPTDPAPSSDTTGHAAGRIAGVPVPAGAGTVAEFEAWLRRTADAGRGARGYAPTTLRQVRSTWTTVQAELQLPDTSPVDALDPADLVSRFAARRSRFHSHGTYRRRLRVGIGLFTAERNGTSLPEPRLRRRTHPADAADRPGIAVVWFPARPGLRIRLECPLDLRADEADRIAMMLQSMVIPPPR